LTLSADSAVRPLSSSDVDRGDVVGRRGERGLEVDRRVLLDERGAEVVAADAAAGRPAGHEVLLAPLRVDQRNAVEDVALLVGLRVLELLERPVAEGAGDLDRVSGTVARE